MTEEKENEGKKVEDLERQIQITTPGIQITLVTHSPEENMNYLIKKAKEFLNKYNSV